MRQYTGFSTLGAKTSLLDRPAPLSTPTLAQTHAPDGVWSAMMDSNYPTIGRDGAPQTPGRTCSDRLYLMGRRILGLMRIFRRTLFGTNDAVLTK